jgi:ABC-2 type transport system permease protein
MSTASTRYRTLFRAVAYKRAILLIRYPVNTLSTLVSIYAVFALIFFGGRAVAGPELTGSLDGIVVGFFLFTMTIVAFSSLAWDMTREAQWGTLEQLFMSPYGFGRVVVTKVIVNVGFSLLWGAVILALMLVTTDRSLTVDVVTVVPIAVLALASAVGVGFVFAAMALLYKRVENVFQLVQWGFIGLIAAPVGAYPALKVLPLAQGSGMLQVAMRDGVRIWEFAPADLAILIAVAVGYFGAGYLVFQSAQRRARRKGLLGKY